MKKLLVLIFSILISFNSYGEWMEVGTDISDDSNYYIDTDTIKERGGYVHYWYLVDFIKPYDDELDLYDGSMSGKLFVQGDCGLTRIKVLSYIFYKQPMGEGIGDQYNLSNSEWVYLPPESVGELMLDMSCDYVD